MITMALKVMVAHNESEGVLGLGNAKYTVRYRSAQCREILHNFFTTIFGQMEGRVALGVVSAFVSQLETGQGLPQQTSADAYDLSGFLEQAYKKAYGS